MRQAGLEVLLTILAASTQRECLASSHESLAFSHEVAKHSPERLISAQATRRTAGPRRPVGAARARARGPQDRPHRGRDADPVRLDAPQERSPRSPPLGVLLLL